MAKVTSRGQVTIPKEVRERLGVRPGESAGFEEREGLLVISKVVAMSSFDKWMGRQSIWTGGEATTWSEGPTVTITAIDTVGILAANRQ